MNELNACGEREFVMSEFGKPEGEFTLKTVQLIIEDNLSKIIK